MTTYQAVRRGYNMYRSLLWGAVRQGFISLSLWLGSRMIRGYVRRYREAKARATELQRSEVVAAWFATNGDKTMRLDYALSAESVVFDLGGYEGSWASDIHAMYQSRVYIFEPVDRFYQFIYHRFRQNEKIKPYKFGLSEKDRIDKLYIDADSSSTFCKSGNEAKKVEEVKFVEICRFLKREGIEEIDLMKINIEGGEYDLMEHILDIGLQKRINNIQIQFHVFVPNAVERMNRIKDRLRKTHSLTYEYEFVWENWALRNVVDMNG